MSPEQKEGLRTAILQVLDERASERFGLSMTAIQIFLAQYGFRGVKKELIFAELQYLTDKTLTAPVSKTISPENGCWRITGEGRDFVALTQPNE